MSYDRILIPTDGSKTSEHIIEFICSIQKAIHAEINVVYVVEVPRNLPLSAPMPDITRLARTALDRSMDIAEKYGARINSSIIYSRTIEDSIITTAEQLQCDVIAIGQDNQKLRIFSNTASNIYQRAKCNVWLFNNKT